MQISKYKMTARPSWRNASITIAIACFIWTRAASPQGPPNGPDVASVHAEILATGIPGAGAIAQIGVFHKGGPFHDNAVFAATTSPGQKLDQKRLLVASTSNFGAPLARLAEAPGSV